MLLFLHNADRKPMLGRFIMALILAVSWAAATAVGASGPDANPNPKRSNNHYADGGSASYESDSFSSLRRHA